MGLFTKQAPADQALDWSQTLLESAVTVELPKPTPIRRQQQQQQQQQQQSEPLDCPRCGSTNTKFCYYNNYNKSQPRHFCKACKRHWTKGGTLRNVPVGGGRKNKRLRASNNSATSSSSTTGITVPTSASDKKNVHVLSQNQQDSNNFSLPALGDQKNISDILYQALINSSSSAQHDPINGFPSKTLMGSKGTSSSSPMLLLPQDQNLQFSFSSPFENIPSPIPSFHQSLNGYDYGGKLDSVESSTITTVTPTTSSIFSQPWQGPTTSSVIADMPNYWNWNDIDTLVSADLNIPWDDTEIKP